MATRFCAHALLLASFAVLLSTAAALTTQAVLRQPTCASATHTQCRTAMAAPTMLISPTSLNAEVPSDQPTTDGRLPMDLAESLATKEALLAKMRTAGARTLVTGSSLGGIIGANLALRQLFAMCAIRFPSPLAGMLLLFGGLCATQALSPALASRLEAALAPGCAFISRWLALFFVPNLVVLPLVLSMSPFEAARLLLVIVGGLACSIPLAALVAVSALPKASPDAAATAKAPVEASPATSGSAVLASQSSSPRRSWCSPDFWRPILGASSSTPFGLMRPSLVGSQWAPPATASAPRPWRPRRRLSHLQRSGWRSMRPRARCWSACPLSVASYSPLRVRQCREARARRAYTR
jgi:putative effector of murein hydrolase LrgA (UPF0299 family)